MAEGLAWPSKFIYLMKMSKGCVVLVRVEGVLRGP